MIKPDYGKIRERLLTHGWWKSAFGNEEGPNCLAGAAIQVREDRIDLCYLDGSDLIAVIKEQFPERMRAHTYDVGWGDVTDFNDWSDTTLEDVLLVLDKAARKAEEAV